MKGNSVLALAIAVLLAVGCVEEEKRDPKPDAGADATAAETSSSSGGTSSSSGGETQDVPTAFKPACTADSDCKTNHLCVEGVCVPKLVGDKSTQITDPTKDYQPSKEKLDTSCYGKSIEELVKDLPEVATVTMWGRVDRFGGGGPTVNVEVAVFKKSDFKPQACAMHVSPKASSACYGDESKVGKPLAKVVSVGAEEAVKKGWDVKRNLPTDVECTKGHHLDCPHGDTCDEVDGFVKCTFQHGLFAMSGLPTNVPLIVRTRAAGANDTNGWRVSYIWNVVLFSNKLDPKGEGEQPTAFIGQDTYRYNPTIVGEGQWKLVPDTIGVLGGISDGDGVIGGRVRDCGSGDRRSWSMVNAKVGIGIPPEGLTYFNDSEVSTVPNKSRTETNLIGRYAAVGIPAGPNRVAALGKLNGKDVPLAATDVFVIPNSLVIVSLPGYVPYLNK
jgi:hypothetical protein